MKSISLTLKFWSERTVYISFSVSCNINFYIVKIFLLGGSIFNFGANCNGGDLFFLWNSGIKMRKSNKRRHGNWERREGTFVLDQFNNRDCEKSVFVFVFVLV